MRSSLKQFKKSVSHALDGLGYVVRHERNFRIELFFAVLVMGAILFFDMRGWEAVILILMIAAVLVAELTNTVFERVVDILKPRIHPYARLIKDIMASVVLLTSLTALVVGVIVLWPHFYAFFVALF
ncbi:MAG TPA: diacylglycerol kinase [Candidatus Moranbacteria bacterium]|nr:diacylglycerol kinase [Candidatus Moranbacteria bacterium]